MTRQSKYVVTTTGSVLDAVSEACSALQDLGAECRDVVDSCPESLRSSARIESLENSASALEGISEPDDLETLRSVKCTWSTNRHPRASRASRCGDAIATLTVALDAAASHREALEEKSPESEIIDDISSWCDSVQSIIDDAEGCEFPGMCG